METSNAPLEGPTVGPATDVETIMTLTKSLGRLVSVAELVELAQGRPELTALVSLMNAKWEMIRAYVDDKERNGIRQQSQEWHEARRFKIGGSSMSILLGINPFQNLRGLILERAGHTHSDSRIAMHWGNMFEDVIKTYVEHDYKCQIIGEDLYILGPGESTYSPDGLAVIMHPERGPSAVLLEFKCPFTKALGTSVPDNYVAQIKLGLDIVPADWALYAAAVFRRCTIAQLSGEGYVLTGGQKGVPRPKPRARGAIVLYIDLLDFGRKQQGLTEDTEEHRKAMAKAYDVVMLMAAIGAKNHGDTQIRYDFGESNDDTFGKALRLFVDKMVCAYYAPISYDDEPASMDAVQTAWDAFARDKKVITLGVLPWKLYDIVYHTVDPHKGFLDTHLSFINEVAGVIRRCAETKDLQACYRLIDTVMPSADVGFD